MSPDHSYEGTADLVFNAGPQPSATNLVYAGGRLPCCIQVDTSGALNVILGIHPRLHSLSVGERRRVRRLLNERLWARARPSFYCELTDAFHIAYAGQPGGRGTQHHWRIFCTQALFPDIQTLAGQPVVSVEPGENTENTQTSTNGYPKEWGGLTLRSEAELKIAQALNETELLFFANTCGRVGLGGTPISNSQLRGFVESDFLVFHKGKCIVLEVDGQHHTENGQTIRDYARDRVLLSSGLPTVRFTARDCLDHPSEVVAELLSILTKTSG